MIKVIKENPVPRATVNCTNCGSVLEYGNSDLNKDYGQHNETCAYSNAKSNSYYLRCPVCGCEIKHVAWIKSSIIELK